MYKLLEWNQLSRYQKELLSGLHDESEVYGVFEPASASTELTFKVAYREVAMLYLHLEHFHKLPHYFIVSGTRNINEVVARLILDHIIQIEWEGNYVSGPEALTAIYGEAVFEEQKLPNYLSDLSRKAIYYAWMLNETDFGSVASRLYTFNTIPWDAFEKATFYSTHSVKEFLFSRAKEAARQTLDKQWYPFSDQEKNSWLSWMRSSPEKSSTGDSTFIYKLYISPYINDLPEVFVHFIPVISASAAFSFKVGSTIEGLLRPDKMVAYFDTREALLQTAGILETELSGYPAQGVPFTTQLDTTGLLSYGVDPPQTDVLNLIEQGSWRTTITDHLALAILKSKKQQLHWPQAMGFIRAMLLTAGIDNYQWTMSDRSNNTD